MPKTRRVLKITVPPDKPEDWVNGYAEGYLAGYKEGVMWAREAAIKVIKDKTKRTN